MIDSNIYFIIIQNKDLFTIMDYTCIYNNSSINFYNIENVQERFIPTYYHTQIFATEDVQPMKVRYTPTFHSRVMPSDPKIPDKNFIKLNKAKFRPYCVNSTKKAVYKNVSRQKKHQHFYNSKGNCNYNRQQLWYDTGKSELFDNMQLNKKYSKDRKLIDLSSGDVFESGKIAIPQVKVKEVEKQSVPIDKNVQQQSQKEPENEQKIKTYQILNQNIQKGNQIKQIRVKFQEQIQQVNQKSIIKKQNKNKPKNIPLSHVIEGYPKFTIIRNKPF